MSTPREDLEEAGASCERRLRPSRRGAAMADSARSVLSDPGWAATARHELDRIDAALSLAEAATERLRRVLRPGTSDSVASMLVSDLKSAGDRAEWLRARLEEEMGGGGG